MIKMQVEMQLETEMKMEVEVEMDSLSTPTSVAEVHVNQNTDTNSNVAADIVITEPKQQQQQQKQSVCLSVAEKLRRFCYIGTFDVPIFAATTLDLTVESHFPVLLELCAQISQRELIECLSSVLAAGNAEQLPRRDEALLVLAVYLSSCTDDKERNSARGHFVMLVTSGKDLLLFIKFVKRVQSLMKRKTPFSRTIRKAVIDWYKLQPLERLLEMWSMSDCEYCTHRDLLFHCHYTSEKFDMDILAALRLIFTPPKEVILWPDHLDPLINLKEFILGIAKVRLAQKPEEALPIVQQLHLGFQHVPRILMSDPQLLNILLPKMSYDQLLETWQKFLNVFKVHRDDQRKYTELFFDESKLRDANVTPIRLLIQESRLIKRKRLVTRGVVPTVHSTFMLNLYKRCFGLNKPIGLRLHITINLEKCYIGKYLNGRWRSVKYLDAVLALAFGYYKSESQVNVRIWYDKSGRLKPLPWTPTMTVDEAKSCCEMQQIVKIKQTLTDVIDNALNDAANTFDAFLVLVPSATRGNPNNNSDELFRRLNEYRQTRNPNAKFIIMSLRENHGSMTYSKERKENILELCGISDQMPRLINAFANGKFV
ncbi:uncharacterized protein LOC117791501 [Drosophila innubila]|uniref:uncharacterized protein LOC117791501 n=1 Tax=Drosophila innubila TaxID=198719 RepID=UPI00148DA76A|nr:uncharacterized protein LOC117791501 [Drosophila innubila]